MGRLNADPSFIGSECFAANRIAARPQITLHHYNRCVCRSPSWYRLTSPLGRERAIPGAIGFPNTVYRPDIQFAVDDEADIDRKLCAVIVAEAPGMCEMRCMAVEVSAGDQRRRQATVQISVHPGNIQQHEILVRWSRLRTASITKSPAKYEKLCSSDRPPAPARGATWRGRVSRTGLSAR
jgi:hypothetical protein